MLWVQILVQVFCHCQLNTKQNHLSAWFTGGFTSTAKVQHQGWGAVKLTETLCDVGVHFGWSPSVSVMLIIEQ